MSPTLVSVVSDFDDCLVALDDVGGLHRQQRLPGQRYSWEPVDGPEGKVVKRIALRTDGTIVVLATDGTLHQRARIGGSRDAAEYAWVEIELPREEAA